MPVLTHSQISAGLVSMPEWQLKDRALERTLEFADFVAAMRFVNVVAETAEHAGHHPDIDIRYNKVRLVLSSHDSGGVTERDLALAESIQKILAH